MRNTSSTCVFIQQHVNKLKIRSQETGQETIEESDSGVMRNKPGLS